MGISGYGVCCIFLSCQRQRGQFYVVATRAAQLPISKSRKQRHIMSYNENRIGNTRVVGTFDTQDEADEAVLELRLAGFKDRRIGYYARTATGQITDLLERNFWIVGATVGTIVGVLLGIWTARPLFPGGKARTSGGSTVLD